ncbi:MAG TPA: type II toxin-antitoxin system VapC family toxin [Acidimicrobiia bacterium]|nr:type II toxin-antitoxin system VapC family toxin [Acidimicrobiia bacterium]
MIVTDASAAVLALLKDGDARRILAREAVSVPHLADSEVVHALRSQVIRRAITSAQAAGALGVWSRLGLRRFEVAGLVGRIWELGENLTGYDATYVALAEYLESPLLTADARLGNAPGPTCPITVVKG